MSTFKVGISSDIAIVHITANANSLPLGYTQIGTYDHDESDDPQGAYADGHTHFHHVRDLLDRTSRADPSESALFPDNITDLASISIIKAWEAAPVVLTAPAITGTAQVGQTLTAGAGTWTGPTTPAYARRWFADGELIYGATAATYVPVIGDIGKAITVETTATNAFGATIHVSAATADVIAA